MTLTPTKTAWYLTPANIQSLYRGNLTRHEFDWSSTYLSVSAHFAATDADRPEQVDFDEFEAAAEQAIAINDNQSILLADLGLWLTYAGRWERGIELLERAMELNPRHPDWFWWPFCLDSFRLKEFKDARDCVHKMNLPNNHYVHTLLAAIYAELGEVNKANEAIEHILSIHPPFAEDPRRPYTTRRISPELIEAIMDGLRKSGYHVPEHAG